MGSSNPNSPFTDEVTEAAAQRSEEAAVPGWVAWEADVGVQTSDRECSQDPSPWEGRRRRSGRGPGSHRGGSQVAMVQPQQKLQPTLQGLPKAGDRSELSWVGEIRPGFYPLLTSHRVLVTPGKTMISSKANPRGTQRWLRAEDFLPTVLPAMSPLRGIWRTPLGVHHGDLWSYYSWVSNLATYGRQILDKTAVTLRILHYKTGKIM